VGHVRLGVKRVACLGRDLLVAERPRAAALRQIEELLVHVGVRRVVLGAGLDVANPRQHVRAGW